MEISERRPIHFCYVLCIKRNKVPVERYGRVIRVFVYCSHPTYEYLDGAIYKGKA